MVANETRKAVHDPKVNGIPSRPRITRSENDVRRRMRGAI